MPSAPRTKNDEMTATVRIGTRGSRLALAQVDIVSALLAAAHPGLDVEREIIKTTGDKILDTALSRIGDKGLFTKELETALLEGRIDLAVHSLKDVPTKLPDGLVLGAILEREDPSDALVGPAGTTLDGLPRGARIGTSSLRRTAQLRALRPDLEVLDLRGNVPTRIDKVDRGEYDAIVLARAGLVRLGLAARIAEVVPMDRLLPAVGQGAIAIEIRADDPATAARIAVLDHTPTRRSVMAERALLARLEGGCQVPIGAHGRAEGDRMVLDGLVAAVIGSPCLRTRVEAPLVSIDDDAAAAALGREAAERLLAMGAGAILEEIARDVGR